MKTLTAPMKKHLKMTTAELTAERENEIACIAHTAARIDETDPSDTRYIAVMRGWITGSGKAIVSIDLALSSRGESPDKYGCVNCNGDGCEFCR